MNRKQKTVLIGMIGNFLLSISKTFLSLISGSSALLADALHSFSDLIVSLVVFTGVKLNKKKIEAIISLSIGILILTVAIGFAIKLVRNESSVITHTGWAVFGQTIIIVCTYILYKYKTIIGTEEQSLSLVADGHHTKSDMWSSFGVLISLSGSLIGLNLDRAAAFIIFFLVVSQGVETIIGSIQIFTSKGNSDEYLYNSYVGKILLTLFFHVRKKWFKKKKKYIPILILLVFIVGIIPGFYSIDQSEVGLRSCKGITDSKLVDAGIHFNPLYFISSIEKINIREIKTLYFGYRIKNDLAGDIIINQWETIDNSQKYQSIENENSNLSGDGSIVSVNLIVEYRIEDPLNFSVLTEKPEEILRIEISSQLRKTCGSISLFKILNSDRTFIEKEMKERLNASMDLIGTGLFVEDIILYDITPHRETLYMFRTVQNEEQYKETLIYDAEAVKEKQIPYYRGLAYEKIENAKAEAREIILKAQREIVLYKVLEKEYIRNEGALQQRLLLQNRTGILKDSEKILIEKSIKDNFIRIDQRRGEQ
jgi:membrane protease subunit HflK